MAPSPGGAVLISAAVAAAGYGARALTRGGALAATLVGSAILVGAGWAGAAALGAFFVAGSAISRILPPGKAAGDAKGDRRDAAQVLANGGAAAVAALAGMANPALAAWLVTGSLASASADTWATAIGARSPTPPRLLLAGRAVPPGTSGGMSLPGSCAAILGALVVALPAAWVSRDPRLAFAGTAIGVAGMGLDSALGALLQGRFRCPACEVATERPVHHCGTAGVRTGGWAWLDNDRVNLLTTAAGALLGALAYRLGSR